MERSRTLQLLPVHTAAAALAVVVTLAAPAVASGLLRLSPTGVGPVRFGMTAAEASAAVHARVRVMPGINGCSFWTIPGFDAQRTELIAFAGRLGYAQIGARGPSTTRRTRVGDTVRQLRHRYRHLRHGTSGSLNAVSERLFTDQRAGGRTYTIEFDIFHGKVASISAGTRHTIETFGECA